MELIEATVWNDSGGCKLKNEDLHNINFQNMKEKKKGVRCNKWSIRKWREPHLELIFKIEGKTFTKRYELYT
jgi:hypothetical protein